MYKAIFSLLVFYDLCSKIMAFENLQTLNDQLNHLTQEEVCETSYDSDMGIDELKSFQETLHYLTLSDIIDIYNTSDDSDYKKLEALEIANQAKIKELRSFFASCNEFTFPRTDENPYYNPQLKLNNRSDVLKKLEGIRNDFLKALFSQNTIFSLSSFFHEHDSSLSFEGLFREFLFHLPEKSIVAGPINDLLKEMENTSPQEEKNQSTIKILRRIKSFLETK